MAFDAAVAGVAVIAGIVASVTGFGIGSLLTPVLAGQVGTKAAVALVALPHVGGTALRFWMQRIHVDRHLLLNFGIASAACGLIGMIAGARLLRWIPEALFRRIVGPVVLAIGIFMLVHPV